MSIALFDRTEFKYIFGSYTVKQTVWEILFVIKHLHMLLGREVVIRLFAVAVWAEGGTSVVLPEGPEQFARVAPASGCGFAFGWIPLLPGNGPKLPGDRAVSGMRCVFDPQTCRARNDNSRLPAGPAPCELLLGYKPVQLFLFKFLQMMDQEGTNS